MRIGCVCLAMIVSACGARVVTYAGPTPLSDGGRDVHDARTNTDSGRPAMDAPPMDVSGDATDASLADRADNGTCEPDASGLYTAISGCFESTYCPPTYFASTRDQLTSALGMCNTDDFSCCGETIIDQVVCGPRYLTDLCCYTLVTRVNDPCMGGGHGTYADAGPGGCIANGQPCNLPTDCCTGQCNVDFVCGPIECRPEGSPCRYNEDCCELQCTSREPLGVICWHCAPDGSPCGDGGVACCSGACGPQGVC